MKCLSTRDWLEPSLLNDDSRKRLLRCGARVADRVARLITFIALLQLIAIATLPSTVLAQFSVSVTPKGALEPSRSQHTAGFVSQLFTVTNTSTSTGNQSYALSCSNAGNVTCTGTSKTNVTLAKGASTTLTATYSTTNTGTGTVYVKADNGLVLSTPAT